MDKDKIIFVVGLILCGVVVLLAGCWLGNYCAIDNIKVVTSLQTECLRALDKRITVLEKRIEADRETSDDE